METGVPWLAFRSDEQIADHVPVDVGEAVAAALVLVVEAADYAGVYDTDFVVETSTTLEAGSWTDESVGVTVVVGASSVTYTFPGGPLKTFARLKVTGP